MRARMAICRSRTSRRSSLCESPSGTRTRCSLPRKQLLPAGCQSRCSRRAFSISGNDHFSGDDFPIPSYPKIQSELGKLDLNGRHDSGQSPPLVITTLTPPPFLSPSRPSENCIPHLSKRAPRGAHNLPPLAIHARVPERTDPPPVSPLTPPPVCLAERSRCPPPPPISAGIFIVALSATKSDKLIHDRDER